MAVAFGCLCCVDGCLTPYFDCFVIWLVFIAMISWLARVGLGDCWWLLGCCFVVVLDL